MVWLAACIKRFKNRIKNGGNYYASYVGVASVAVLINSHIVNNTFYFDIYCWNTGHAQVFIEFVKSNLHRNVRLSEGIRINQRFPQICWYLSSKSLKCKEFILAGKSHLLIKFKWLCSLKCIRIISVSPYTCICRPPVCKVHIFIRCSKHVKYCVTTIYKKLYV